MIASVYSSQEAPCVIPGRIRRQGDAALFERYRTEIARLAAEPTFWTDRFHSTDALNAYADIGRELLTQTEGHIDVFCGAVGTGGMVAGVARAAVRSRAVRP
jgi:cysteine synthase A